MVNCPPIKSLHLYGKITPVDLWRIVAHQNSVGDNIITKL